MHVHVPVHAQSVWLDINVGICGPWGKMKACQDDLHVHVSQCIGEHAWIYDTFIHTDALGSNQNLKV